MGFSSPALQFFIEEHKRAPFQGPVLTLGKQRINASYQQMLAVFAHTGIAPQPLPPGMTTDALPGVGGPGETNDVAFFRHLGADVMSLDYSDFEGADIIQDLNEPIPATLRGRFGTIIDGGTIEHVFDIRRGFANIAELLAPGGRIIHLSPTNNYANHGFWQLSPTVFFDFYGTNGFVDLRAKMVVGSRDPNPALPWHVFDYRPEQFGTRHALFNSINDQLGTYFIAQKTAESTSERIPVQSFYVDSYAAAASGTSIANQQILMEYTPQQLRVRVVGPGQA